MSKSYRSGRRSQRARKQKNWYRQAPGSGPVKRASNSGFCCVCGRGIGQRDPVAYLESRQGRNPGLVHPGECYRQAMRTQAAHHGGDR